MIQNLLASLLLLLPLQLPDVQAQVAETMEAAKTKEAPVESVSPPPSPEPPPPAPKPVQATTAPSGGVLACIRRYEQGSAGYLTNTGNGYYGAYQFNLATWRSVGGTGYPHNASAAEQDKRASILLSRRGLSPWPTPNRLCR
jgi:hypothetical protein